MLIQIAELSAWLTDMQKWFSTSKVGPLVVQFCRAKYGTSRSFIFPSSETRFAGKLIQLKRIASMKEALQALVESAQYQRFEFENDIFKDKILGDDMWETIEVVTKTAGPILLLLRLADSNNPSLSKLKATVDHIQSTMVEPDEDGTLEEQISFAFHNRVDDLESDVASAAYLLDPQFISKSRNADADTMSSFWKVSRSVLKVTDDAAWRVTRNVIVEELNRFRMKIGPFAYEDYTTSNTCAFWGVAGDTILCILDMLD